MNSLNLTYSGRTGFFTCRILLIQLFFFFIIACSPDASESIKFGLSTAPVTLDPRYATDAVSHRINRLLYSRLVDFDSSYNMVPVLADWTQITPTIYRFTLKKNHRIFHDGSFLTSEDVKATYDSILDNTNISPHRSTLSNIEHIHIEDTDTIDFYLHKPDPLFPGRLVIGILPAPLIRSGHPFQNSPVGSGEMKFIEWPTEDHLILKRLRDNRLFEFITVKDSTVRVLKLVRGEIDLIQGDLPFELLDWLSMKKNITTEKHYGDVYTYIGFNMQDPSLAQLNIRRAIAHAIDRGAIIRNVLGNSARIAGTLLPREHWAAHPGLYGYKYNPDKSRELLMQSGYGKDKRLKLSYKTSNNPLRVRLATIIQFQLQQVGIDVEVKSYDWGTFYSDIKDGHFQMYSLSWVGLNMPDIFHYVFHSSSVPPAGANRGRFHDSYVDTLIDTADIETSHEKQTEMYRELQVYLQEKIPYISLWYEDNILARQKNVKGYKLSADGNYDGLLQANRIQ